MPKPTHKDVRHLLNDLIMPFYLVKRDMRVTQGQRRRENDAEHSWSLALLACALAPQIAPQLDVGKICQFAIVHDLVELYAGDTTPWGPAKPLATKDHREAEAFARLTAEFAAFPWIAETLKDYESKTSEEAKFVWAADKYIAVYMRHLDDGRFYRQMKFTKEAVNQRLVVHRQKAHAHKSIAEYYELVRAEMDQSDHFYKKTAASNATN